jgi:hypothetical protein
MKSFTSVSIVALGSGAMGLTAVSSER